MDYADAKFDEGDTVTVESDGYEVIEQVFSENDYEEVPVSDAAGKSFEVTSVDWTDLEPEYNLTDDEGNRVWSVRESDLR